MKYFYGSNSKCHNPLLNKLHKLHPFVLILLSLLISTVNSEKYGNPITKRCDSKNNHETINSESCSEKDKRYILYEVNPGEGFNLRRDVYIRIAPLVKQLNQQDSKHLWILVLPPWRRLPHWRTTPPSKKYPWSTYFDIGQIQEYIPVLEFEDYMEEYGLDNPLDLLYQLQHFPFTETSGEWKEEVKVGVVCQDYFPYTRDKSDGNIFKGTFWGHKISVRDASCVSLRGQASTLKPFLLQKDLNSIMLDRAEVILWDHYGGEEWWAARKSLKFSPNIHKQAQDYLKANNLRQVSNSRKLENDEMTQPNAHLPFISVHLRRRDFLQRKKPPPTLHQVAQQILTLSTQLSISTVFISTDADETELQNLLKLIKSSDSSLKPLTYDCHLSDGECAIIDQILCSVSDYFVGTEESTFTFRIFEEREIMGSKPEKTYNYLCQNYNTSSGCKKPTRWPIPAS